MWSLEREYQSKGFSRIAGVDEVGRGSLSGPVVAAAYIAKPIKTHPEVRDSKELSEAQREKLYPILIDTACDYSVGLASSREVDVLNILGATRLAMYRALRALSPPPDIVLVDGVELKLSYCPSLKIIRGDATVGSIAAASVIAKVTRDILMVKLHSSYPVYGWKRNKGYGTREHLVALRQWGPCPLHRVTFCSVRQPKLVL